MSHHPMHQNPSSGYCACVLVGVAGLAVGGLAGMAIDRRLQTRYPVGTSIGMIAGGLLGAVGYKAVAGS